MAVIETPGAVDQGPTSDLDAKSLPKSELQLRNEEQSLNGGDNGDVFKREIKDLEDLLSKLNPMAAEFVPPSVTKSRRFGDAGHYLNGLNHVKDAKGGGNGRRTKNGYTQGRRRMNSRTSMAQRDEIIRRTVYVTDIDQQVTEEQLATVFINCGQVVDCRICGDPNSILHFAFIEFTDEEGARAALNLTGTVLGFYPVRVLPSKTAIAPVNPTFLPRSEDEREMCARTVYCTNIDKKVSQADVKLFFESICGEVYRLRLLGDFQHSTRIAFVEFAQDQELTKKTPTIVAFPYAFCCYGVAVRCMNLWSFANMLLKDVYKAESAIAALSCSGVVLGSLPIRVSPSKTPVRPRTTRPPHMH